MNNLEASLRHIIPEYHYDHRGFFTESYNKKKYLKLGINVNFVQDNRSLSRGLATLRGLHFQAPPHAQAKLVSCGRGAIYDVAVDIRRGSPHYGQWAGYELSAENGHQLFIPVGFAHGFLTLQPNTEVLYKCSDYYAAETEGSLLWNDPSVAVDWPLREKPILSDKDQQAPLLKDFRSPFIYGVNS